MKFFLLFGVISILANCSSTNTKIDQVKDKKCDKNAESYLMAIGNVGESYEVVELQLNDGFLSENSVVYNSKYRLSSYTKEYSMKLTLDYKNCVLNSAYIIRD